MRLFLGKYTQDGKENCFIYYNNADGWKQWHADTFSPLTENEAILLLKVSGKNYAERKENARQLAIDYQYDFASLSWSYGELVEIYAFFEKVGKRYGLLTEFKENAIC